MRVKKLNFFIPHIFWLLITVILVEVGFFKDIIDLAIFLLLSMAIYLVLEMKRNKKLSNPKKLSRARITTYIISNIILGYFAGMVYLFLIPVIYFMTHPLGYMDSGLTPIEFYLFISMFIIWVVINSLILRVNSIQRLILFLVSPFSMIIIPTALVLLSRL